jgi:hypothetical protein
MWCLSIAYLRIFSRPGFRLIDGVIVMWESRDFQMKDGEVIRAIAFFDMRGFDEFWTRVSPAP